MSTALRSSDGKFDPGNSYARSMVRDERGQFIKANPLAQFEMVAVRDENEKPDLRELMRERNPVVSDDIVPGKRLRRAIVLVLVIASLVLLGNLARG